MSISVPTMQQLLEAGVHFGHQVRRGNPKMNSYIYGARDGIHIIDLASSEQKLKEAAEAAYDLGKSGAVLLVVGTKKQAREIVETLAKEADTPYLTERWVGGMLTNFDEIKKNLKKLTGLKEDQEKGQLAHYTKKERLLISRKVTKFEEQMGGVANLDKVPQAMFVIDAVADNTAVKEANRMGITLIGLCDTNANPFWFDYPVPANDDGIKAIKIIAETILKAYSEGKKEAGAIAQKQAEDKIKAEAKAELEAEQSKLGSQVAEEAAAIEEQVEKQVVADSERKV